MKFCVKCGNKITEGILCKNCQAGKISVKPIKISFCTCKRYLAKKGWRDYTSMKDVVANTLDPHPDLIITKLDLNFEHKDRTFDVKCRYGAKEVTVPVTIRKRICEKCEKKNTDYFEGVLQIRYSKDLPEEETSIYDDVAKVVETARKRRVFVTKVMDQKRGVDIYLTSQKYLQVLARKLQSQWGADLKITSTLHTRDKQTTKDLYRVTALLTLLPFKKGSIVKQQGKLYRIEILGKIIKAKELHINKTKTIVPNDFEVLSPQKTRVIKLEPHIEVLDPNTYETVPIKNPPGTLTDITMNMQVKVVYDQGWWIV